MSITHYVERGTPHFYAADATGILVILGSYVGVLQGVVALLASMAALTWYSVQVFEWFERRRIQRKQLVQSAARVVEAVHPPEILK